MRRLVFSRLRAKIPRLQPPRQLETLDDLLAQAVHASFGESNMPVLDKIEGRFAQILPPKVATPEHRSLAQAMLKVKGVNFAKPGTAIRLMPPKH